MIAHQALLERSLDRALCIFYIFTRVFLIIAQFLVTSKITIEPHQMYSCMLVNQSN